MAEVVRIERRQVAKDGTHERECRPLHRAPLKSRERERETMASNSRISLVAEVTWKQDGRVIYDENSLIAPHNSLRSIRSSMVLG